MSQLKGIVFFSGHYYVAPLFGLFYLGDLIYYPELKQEFLAYRLVTIALAILIARTAQARKSLQATQINCTLITVVCNLCLNVMIIRIGTASTPYYAGLILTTMGVAIGYRYTWRFYWLNIGLCTLPFILFVAYRFTDKWGVLSALFLTGVALIGTVSRVLQELLYNKEITARSALETEVNERGRTIERKTIEALELSNLAKQFSPQVVEAIREGQLNVSRPVHRSEIAVIFIDIVGSTERFVRLDRDELHRVLTMFMDDTMESLLQYDLTIDKFLGDAILGFSNDPIKHADFIERAISAGLLTLRKIKEKERTYNELWMAPFNVGIGIASGFASVGFYGSEKFMKNYTAIGRPVNLASRLASMTEPGKILVPQETVRSLEKNKSEFLESIELQDIGQSKIRSFESDSIRLFAVSEKSVNAKAAKDQVSPICPIGHGELILDINARGIFSYNCPTCGFELDNLAEFTQKKAA